MCVCVCVWACLCVSVTGNAYSLSHGWKVKAEKIGDERKSSPLVDMIKGKVNMLKNAQGGSKNSAIFNV